MKKLYMDKVITVIDGKLIPYRTSYTAFAAAVENDTEVEAIYPQGMKAHRERQLAKLGFTLKAAIHTPDPEVDPIYAEVRGIWQR